MTSHVTSSLYEWIRLSEKAKASTKASDKSFVHFLPGHGQSNTHIVKIIPSRSKTHLLNFIGGPLPQCDQGDFEYYCCTMLTLFKPWRNSGDLKDESESWAEAFTLYEFKFEDKKIMSNFNLHYECLDERDDYHAILKRQSKLKKKQQSSFFQESHEEEDDFGINSNIQEDYGDPKILGPNAIKKIQQMIEMEEIMKRASWKGDKDNVIMQSKLQIFQPSIFRTGSQWKGIVKQSREKILNLKKNKLLC